MTGKPLKLFISYSHEDELLKTRLRKQFAAMERVGLLKIWDDRAIPPGGTWEQSIRDELDAADLILLLLSPSFIASEYCYGEEMSRAMHRHASNEALVVPVLIRPCQWDLLPFIERRQILPRDAKAVTDAKHWPADPNHDVPLQQVAEELLKLVRDLYSAGPVGMPASPPAEHRADIPSLLPDLCNRGDQDAAFDIALRASLRHPQRRPFVFVLFGEDTERLHGFRERLALVKIPRMLNLEREQTSVECLTLDSPSLAVYRDAAEAFRAELANKLLDDRGKAPEELFAYLGAHAPPLLLVSHFVGRAGMAMLRKAATGMLNFWSQWPDLPPGRTLLHCLSVRFERGNEAAADSTHEEARRLLRRWAARSGGFKDHPRVAGVVLPELASVHRHHVEEWTELREVRKFARIQPGDVAALFESQQQRKPDGSVPMEPLYHGMALLAQQRRC